MKGKNIFKNDSSNKVMGKSRQKGRFVSNGMVSCQERETAVAIFALMVGLESYKEGQKKTPCVSVGLEKVFVGKQREKLRFV